MCPNDPATPIKSGHIPDRQPDCEPDADPVDNRTIPRGDDDPASTMTVHQPQNVHPPLFASILIKSLDSLFKFLYISMETRFLFDD
jgi:hypothetical protein